MQTLSDQDLIALYQNGQESCFEILYHRHKDKIFFTIFSKIGDEDICNDIFQETFIKIIDNIKKGNYDEKGKFINWALRIANNACMDHFRSIQRKKINYVENENIFLKMEVDINSSVENQLISRECSTIMHLLLNNLDEEQKLVIHLRHFEQLSYQEIALKTGININTCLGRMRYALKNLQKMMLEKKIEL
jgi:RNA polymerase sigma-70 factor (ECF subfamily)